MFGDSIKEDKDNLFEKQYTDVKSQKKLIGIDGVLYALDEEYLYYHKLLNKNEELLAINSMIKSSIRDKISPKTIDNILKKLKMDKDIMIDRKFVNPEEYINLKNGIICLKDTIESKGKNKNREFIFTDKNNIDLSIKFTYMLRFNYKEELRAKIKKNTEGLCCSDKDYLEVLYRECPNFKKYAESSLEGDYEKVILLLQSMAYMCTDLIQARKAFIYLGKSASGKSLIAKFLIEIIGDEHVSSIPINKLGDKFNIGEMKKYRVNIATELSRNPIRNSDILKSIISGDRVFGDQKGKVGMHFFSKIKILQLANYLPNTAEIDDSGAFTDRLVIILFNETIPPEKRNKNFLSELLSERDGIMTVAFLLFEKVIQQNFIFKQPKESIEFLENYGSSLVKEVKEFIDDRCITGDNVKEFTKTLYDEYRSYCSDNFLDCCSRNNFIYALDELGYKRTRFRRNSKNCRGYKGLELKQSRGDQNEA